MEIFQSNLKKRREYADNQIKRDEYLKKVFQDPAEAQDFEDDVIEHNLNLLLISNEVHSNVEISQKKRELLKIKQKTIEMLNKLKEKSEAARQSQMASLKRQQAGNFAKAMIGERCEYLMGEYINRLKKKVLERQEQTLKAKNDEMVNSILKKQNFNESFKNANNSKSEISPTRKKTKSPERKSTPLVTSNKMHIRAPSNPGEKTTF